MTRPTETGARNHAGHGANARRRRRWRWILAGVAAVVVIVTGAVAAFIELGPSFAPLALPPGRVSAPAGSLSATWQVADGSLAGFRVEERALGLSNYVGGQTRAVTGVVVISGNTVTSARFRINLAAVKISGKTQPQFTTSLGVRDHPTPRSRLPGASRSAPPSPSAAPLRQWRPANGDEWRLAASDRHAHRAPGRTRTANRRVHPSAVRPVGH